MKAADIVGYRFHPSDKDLVSHHLKRRLLGIQETKCLIPVLNIYDHQPWDLHKIYNEKSDEKSCGKECFFFCPRSNGGGSRTSRKAGGGFWKDTSRKRIIKAGKTVGIKRILVFYEGKQKDSRKTDWVMHEYHLNALNEGAVCDLGAFALCCFKRKPTTKKKEKSPVSVREANLSSPSSSTAIVEVEVPNQEIENAVPDTNVFNVDDLLLQNIVDDEETIPVMSNDSINPMLHHQMEGMLPTDDTTVSDKNELNVDDLCLLQNIGDDDEDLRLLQNIGYNEETSPAISNDSINPMFHHQMEGILPTDDTTVSDTNVFILDELVVQNIGDDEETGPAMSNDSINTLFQHQMDEVLLPTDYATAFSGEQDNSLMLLYDFDKIEDVLCCPDFNELWTQ